MARSWLFDDSITCLPVLGVFPLGFPPRSLGLVEHINGIPAPRFPLEARILETKRAEAQLACLQPSPRLSRRLPPRYGRM